ncbi:MAG: DUF4157 domain-containing protein [Deltaproteobacteria bacterium]|nr:DUF4157 domain-containing protein [Deltaproteobacteria bacterium]
MASDKVETDDLEESIRKRSARAGVAILADDAPKRLDPSLRSEMESVTGADLSDVRIHTGERAGRMADSLGARAFAAGTSDVFFAQGEYAPATAGGKALLAHELTHVAEGHGGLATRHRHPEREELEIRARRSEEMVLAEEQAPPQPAETEMLEPVEVEAPPRTDEAQGDPRGFPVDKADLEDRIVDVIERETRRERDRTGRS